jgi:hypothetical protein
MRKILFSAMALALVTAPVPAFAEQSVNPVPGDAWGGAWPADAAFAPAHRTPVPTRDDIVLANPNACAPIAVPCRVYELKNRSRFTFELQTEPTALLPGALSN